MNNNIEEVKILTENTIYGVLIKLHKLENVSCNIYQNKNGVKYHLTIFGLQPVDEYNEKIRIEKLQLENTGLKTHSKQLVSEIRNLKNKLERCAKKKKFLERLTIYVFRFLKTIKRYQQRN